MWLGDATIQSDPRTSSKLPDRLSQRKLPLSDTPRSEDGSRAPDWK